MVFNFLLVCRRISYSILFTIFWTMDENSNVLAEITDECPVDFSGLSENTLFGHNMLKYFQFEPGYINVNHGSYGAAPKLVSDCAHYWRQRAESNPDRWLRYELPLRLERAAGTMAEYLDVRDPKDLAFVPNTSSGVNAILKSLRLNPNDVLVYFSEAYGAVKLAIQHAANWARAQFVEIGLRYPLVESELLDSLEAVLSNYSSPPSSSRVKLIVVSHISSVPAFVMPVAQVAAMGRRYGIPVLLDGAHALGQTPLNLHQLDPDYYVSSGHKWFFSPRGSALIYANKRLQGTLHPVVISWNYNSGFQAEFHQQGTLDYSNFLAFPAALEFRRRLGDRRIREYNAKLAHYAGETLSHVWATEVLSSAPSDYNEQISMVNVRLPVNDSIVVHTIVERLMLSHRTFLATFAERGQWYARISAQIYNEPSDYDRLAADLMDMKRLLEGPVTNAYPYCVKKP